MWGENTLDCLEGPPVCPSPYMEPETYWSLLTAGFCNFRILLEMNQKPSTDEDELHDYDEEHFWARA